MEHAYSFHFNISKIDIEKNVVEGILTDTLETIDGLETKIAFSSEFVTELKGKLKHNPFRNTNPENIVYYLTGLNKTSSDSNEKKFTHYLTIYYKKKSSLENGESSYYRETIFLNNPDAKTFDRKTTIIM